MISLISKGYYHSKLLDIQQITLIPLYCSIMNDTKKFDEVFAMCWTLYRIPVV